MLRKDGTKGLGDRMNNDIISRAELEKELLKEYSQVVSDRAKYTEELGYSWQVEELDKVLGIVRKIPAIPDERIIALPEGVKPGSGAKQYSEREKRLKRPMKPHRNGESKA